ncbi:MAG: hypothetical protein GVY32_06630 [Gammaproteobacteria bacterium]|nr:hypothetical protein [Gammaproteobacteria bacterium]
MHFQPIAGANDYWRDQSRRRGQHIFSGTSRSTIAWLRSASFAPNSRVSGPERASSTSTRVRSPDSGSSYTRRTRMDVEGMGSSLDFSRFGSR